MKPIRAIAVITCAAIATTALGACRERDTVSAAGATSGPSPSAMARDEALTRAKVWFPPAVSPASADFRSNTLASDGFDANADIDCTFVLEPVGGSTPKFICEGPDG